VFGVNSGARVGNLAGQCKNDHQDKNRGGVKTMKLPILMTFAASFMVSTSYAATTAPDVPRLVVLGRGTVKTPPDIALLSFTIRGEGATSDAAAKELMRKRTSIVDGLSGQLKQVLTVNLGELSILEARDRACDADDDSNRPRLSSGSCEVRGFVAQISASLHLTPIADAGTALALATRLGASNAHINEFSLQNPKEARRGAEAAAVLDARTRATSIAVAAGKRLGDLISVEDQAAGNGSPMDDIVVTAMKNAPPVVAPPPIIINLTPEPIETSASMVVTYRITP
jgi:uncharacterized protein YggE